MKDIKELNKKYFGGVCPSLHKVRSTLLSDRMEWEIMLAHSLKKPREFLYSHPEYAPNIIERLRLMYFLFQYRRGWPVAYITHHKEFYGLDFYVNKHTLIPRPETEMIVEEAIQKISNIKYPISNILLVDVGTGSGCIPVAITKTLQRQKYPTPHPSPNRGRTKEGVKLLPLAREGRVGRSVEAYATDISRRALRVAKKNAIRHGVDIKFIQGNLLDPALILPLLAPLSGVKGGQEGSNLIITANLPYLTLEQFVSEPSIQREPKKALIGGGGGLKYYQELIKQIKVLEIKILKYYNIQYLILLEIDPSQSEKIAALIKTCLPAANVEIKKDLAKRDRLVIISFKKNQYL